jgi:hypothetical protein
MDFLSHREGGVVFYQVFLLSPLQYSETLYCRNCKRLREFEEIEISRESCRGDCEQQGEKLLKLFCLDFVQEFSLRTQQGRKGYKDYHPVGEYNEFQLLNDQNDQRRGLLWSYCFYMPSSNVLFTYNI